VIGVVVVVVAHGPLKRRAGAHKKKNLIRPSLFTNEITYAKQKKKNLNKNSAKAFTTRP